MASQNSVAIIGTSDSVVVDDTLHVYALQMFIIIITHIYLGLKIIISILQLYSNYNNYYYLGCCTKFLGPRKIVGHNCIFVL